MSDYKFYIIRGDGHVMGPPRLATCASDAAAVKTARAFAADGDIEIWQDARLVAYVTPDAPLSGLCDTTGISINGVEKNNRY